MNLSAGEYVNVEKGFRPLYLSKFYYKVQLYCDEMYYSMFLFTYLSFQKMS